VGKYAQIISELKEELGNVKAQLSS